MNVMLLSFLLGAAACALRVSTSEDGNVTLWMLPAHVFMGDTVVLRCRQQTGNTTTFLKDGREIGTYESSISESVTNMTVENVTQTDEGLYQCASQGRQLKSPEVRLNVTRDRGNLTSTEGTPASSSVSVTCLRKSKGRWKWILVSCVVVPLPLIALTVWLLCHYRYQALDTRSCWPVFKQDVAVALPATKQDVTEVQWELSWMEMSSLMDKHLYPGT